MLKRARKADWMLQTAVLSQRMMRDHLRRPGLMLAHLLANTYLGCEYRAESWSGSEKALGALRRKSALEIDPRI